MNEENIINETSKEENKKMTVFYKLRNNEIDAICTGEQSLKFYADLEEEDSKLIYGYIIVDLDMYVLRNKRLFELVESEGDLILRMKEEYRDSLKKYIEG
nr:MAG TPA: hypothetical protein [Caudoviricetes sp.]